MSKHRNTFNTKIQKYKNKTEIQKKKNYQIFLPMQRPDI